MGLLCYNGTFVVLFGFFVLRQDGDPEDCLASNDHETLLMSSQIPQSGSSESSGNEEATAAQDEIVNVGERFRLCFEMLLAVHALAVISLILIRTVRPALAITIYSILPTVLVPLFIFFHLVLFYSRFVHSGRVCSGDYLDLKSDPTTGYLLAQGIFIKTYASILSVTVYFVWCCVCYVSARQTAAINKKRE